MTSNFPLPIDRQNMGASIPRTLHQIWVGGSAPGWVTQYWTEWDLHLTGHGHDWRVRRWTDDDLHRTMTGRIVQRYPSLLETPVVIADLLRVEMVYREGGLYMDSDTIPLQPIEKWTGDRPAWLGQGIPDLDPRTGDLVPYYNNATFGFPAGHPFLAEVWDRATDALRRGIRTAFHVAGPAQYRRVHRASPLGVELPTGPFQSFQGKDKKLERRLGRGLTTAELREMYPEADVMHLSFVSWQPDSFADRPAATPDTSKGRP